MAAFMLHQAAEQALLTIFKKATGWHVNTHNIDKLLRYCSMVNIKYLQSSQGIAKRVKGCLDYNRKPILIPAIKTIMVLTAVN